MQRIQLAASEQFSATTNSFSAVWQPDRQVWLRRIDAMAEIILPGPSRAPETPFLGFWRSQELRAGGTQAVEGSAARRAAATTTLTAASRLPGTNPATLHRLPFGARGRHKCGMATGCQAEAGQPSEVQGLSGWFVGPHAAPDPLSSHRSDIVVLYDMWRKAPVEGRLAPEESCLGHARRTCF